MQFWEVARLKSRMWLETQAVVKGLQTTSRFVSRGVV